MIYLKTDGSPECDKMATAFYREIADVHTSVFSTGEPVQKTEREHYNIDRREGTKVIDFTFLCKLLSSNIDDINRASYIHLLEPTIDSILKSPTDIEYCILLPDFIKNEPSSFRSKVLNDVKIKLHGKCKVDRIPSYYNSHKSNPYQFILNGHNVSLLSLDKELTAVVKHA